MLVLVTILVAIAVLHTVSAVEAQQVAVRLSCSPITVGRGDLTVSELTIDVATLPLGAYQVAVTFDPRALRVMAVEGGLTAEFTADPISNATQYASGRVAILGYNATSLASPTGQVSVARMTFAVTGFVAPEARLGLDVDTVADTDGRVLATEAHGCAVMIAQEMITPTAGTTTPTATAIGTVVPPTGTPAPPTNTLTPLSSPTPSSIPVLPSCDGDCDADGRVTVDELMRGVRIALGTLPIDTCPSFDANGDGEVSVGEIVAGVNTGLGGCFASPTVAAATSLPSATATITPVPTETVAATPTREPKRLRMYQAYPGKEIQLPLCSPDPNDGPLQFAAPSLPAGAVVDPASGVLTWTPTNDQIGAFYVPFECTSAATPPWRIEGIQSFQVSPLDPCVTTRCDPTMGCSAKMHPLEQDCCAAGSLPRISYAEVPCPEGAMLFVGRNRTGIGRIQNCDRLRVINFLQAGAAVRIHIETRCLRVDREVSVQAHLATKNRLVVSDGQEAVLTPRDDGYAERLSLTFPVLGPGPFFELEGAEAILRVTVRDVEGLMLSTERRVVLTFDLPIDLPDP